MTREQDLYEWIAFNSARTTDVEELAASDTVRMAAHILGRTPQYVAAEVSRILSRTYTQDFALRGMRSRRQS